MSENHPENHLRNQARRHHEAHQRLKELLEHPFTKEPLWPIFMGTFLVTVISVLVFMNWGSITEALTPKTVVPPAPPETHGFQTGVLSVVRLDGQASDTVRQVLAQIPSSGQSLGVKASLTLARPKATETIPAVPGDLLKTTVWLTNNLGQGQQFTALNQARARGLQKSILATVYFGEKTPSVMTVLESDTKLLSQMNNALSVDIFAFLNQSASRADTLTEYTNLLGVLIDRCNERISELQSKINFLSGNAASTESQVKQSEQAFFGNLNNFNGPNAEQELAKFVGLQSGNVEVKAKIGTYSKLQSYYKFFLPKITTLRNAIVANRDALIAGVKVTEIQNMSLPLIIQKR